MPEGFEAVTITIRRADGTTAEWCVLLAASEVDRARGLMAVDSLGGYDGMLFRFDEPSTGDFYMFRTELPLSIAWFARDGAFVSASDMTPCPSTDPGVCPRYGADGPYTHALETVQGGLARLGAEPASVLTETGTTCVRTG